MVFSATLTLNATGSIVSLKNFADKTGPEGFHILYAIKKLLSIIWPTMSDKPISTRGKSRAIQALGVEQASKR